MDPLSPYPPMMSTEDLAHFLGCGRDTAAREMQKMPYVTIGNGRRNRTRRISKELVRAQYNVPQPKEKLLRLVK